MSRPTESMPRVTNVASAAVFTALVLVAPYARAGVPARGTPASSKGVLSRTGPSATKGAATPTPNGDAARDEAGAAFKLGTKLVSETKWGEALAAFERAQARVPHAITLFNVGVCERALGRYTAARRTFKAALTEDSERRTVLPQQLRMDATGYLKELERLLSRVELRVTPAEASLAVDGRPVVRAEQGSGTPMVVAGLAPPGKGEPIPAAVFELELDNGRHVLTLSRPGHSDAIVARDFAPGRTPALTLTLDELPATIEISSDQPGALVTVAGRDLGPAPVTVLRPAGSYRVLVEKDGFVPAEARLDVRAGEASTFRASLPLDKPSVVKTWWFWTLTAGVVAGAGVGAYFLAREAPPPVRATVGEGTLGWTVPLP